MITASLVKELREKTGAGMMDCKKALTECDGNIEKAVDWLREKGIAKAAKKSGRIAAEGLSRAAVEGNTGVIFEVNSETDFVANPGSAVCQQAGRHGSCTGLPVRAGNAGRSHHQRDGYHR